MVSQKRDLDYISFNWNKMTAAEFEEHWRTNKISKEADFIHMIQVGVAMVMILKQTVLQPQLKHISICAFNI